MFYIAKRDTGHLTNLGGDQIADKDCTGEHDVKPVYWRADAKSFPTFAEASDFSQNFGPDWYVDEL